MCKLIQACVTDYKNTFLKESFFVSNLLARWYVIWEVDLPKFQAYVAFWGVHPHVYFS